jgi:hypothetical protein
MKLFLGTFMIFSCTLLLFTTSGSAEQKMHELENYYVVYDISGNTTAPKSTLPRIMKENNAGLKYQT